ncbi:MAG: hypothetical protein OEZ06_10940 [Myxococcales bacterium]|nr:hypothetical protein [Myxococcales bacterium]
MQDPLPNVATGSRTEPYATQGLAPLFEEGLLDENTEAAFTLGAAGAGMP